MLNTVALNMTKANSTELDENYKNTEELLNAIEEFLAVYIIPVTSAFGIFALIINTVIICLSKKIRIFQKYILYKNFIEFVFYLIGISFFYRICISCVYLLQNDNLEYEQIFYNLYIKLLGTRIILQGMESFNLYLIWNRLSIVSENKNSIFLTLKGQIIMGIIILTSIIASIPLWFLIKIQKTVSGHTLNLTSDSALTIYFAVLTVYEFLIPIIFLIWFLHLTKLYLKQRILSKKKLKKRDIRYTQLMIYVGYLHLIYRIIDFLCSLAPRLFFILNFNTNGTAIQALSRCIRVFGYFFIYFAVLVTNICFIYFEKKNLKK